MRSLILIGAALLFLAFALSPFHYDVNVVEGTVVSMDCPEVWSKGKGYNKDGTEIMHSADPMATPDRNVIISFHPLDFEPELKPTEDAYVTQTEQTFLPLILPVVVGSKVHFLNEDEFFHNVQSHTPGSRFNIGRRAPNVPYSIKIKKQGVINLMCDIHSHMSAKILSFDTPYFCRVGKDGTFSMKNLPDGRYRVEVFHPSCDDEVSEIEVRGGQVFKMDFKLNKRP
ncbi:carboxypeptidase regulatory-like domain-containing protein [Flavilitoribacter nigricans]|uniref:Rhamnogalacturonan lyase domain-containing protein n=1 Tax=Flavilitoribacter nigricans (strain ATCC 23147 / DSM 23189 / NBRC 102662 / NCIMB 1420 / SS-2) TaxID=1122177 RepID=A0A2D0N605_FLAN2|nr:carboxypeptidase regulatory-like domain-containing protein [Flavilitoribacter nigricans]PHN03203.1 hypothetical protein CRP01_27810 [Flavilitoribacter nigricans DSM 23189 = NBRC 102662]